MDEIELRAPEPRDVDAMYLIENDSRLWHDGVTFAPMSRKQLCDYVEAYDGNIFACGQLRLIIDVPDRERPAGIVDLYDFDRINRRAYVGIIVVEELRRQHVGTAVLEKLKKYCAEILGMHQLAAVVRIDNEASVRLFEQCGFMRTGQFPQWIRRGAEWIDAVHFQCFL